MIVSILPTFLIYCPMFKDPRVWIRD